MTSTSLTPNSDNDPRILIISACSADKKYDGGRSGDILDTTSREELRDSDPLRVLPAQKMYTGEEHRRVAQAYAKLRELGTVDWQIISAGFGLVEHTTEIVPYECTFSRAANDKRDYQTRAERLGVDIAGLTIDDLIREIGRAKSIPTDLACLNLKAYDAIFITLGYEYLLTVQDALEDIPPRNAIAFVPDNGRDLIWSSMAIPATEAEREALGVPMTQLKGTQLRNLAESIETPDELYAVIESPEEVYSRAMADTTATTNRNKPTGNDNDPSPNNKMARRNEGKYAPLTRYLDQQKGNQVKLSFDELETVIDAELPSSAYKHGAWWGNDTSSSQSCAWIEADWTVAAHSRDEKWVRFERVNHVDGIPSSEIDGVRCAICRGPTLPTDYPNPVCHECDSRAQPIERSKYEDCIDPNPVQIDGHKCWRRYRFGGWVTMRDAADCDSLEEFYDTHYTNKGEAIHSFVSSKVDNPRWNPRSRSADIDRFYELLKKLEAKVGGKQKLKDCTGYMDWPDRGIYIFFAPDEYLDSCDQLRVTRIGTHAIFEGASTTLWNRLRTHRGANRGTYEGGGNHRGSVFRKRIGEAIIEREELHEEYSHWGEGSNAKQERRLSELKMERRVSDYLRDLPFLWVNVDDEPSADSQRAYIEQNVIALLSNYKRDAVHQRSNNWLGKHSRSEEIRESGLWNVNHVDEDYDPDFLDTLAEQIAETDPV